MTGLSHRLTKLEDTGVGQQGDRGVAGTGCVFLYFFYYIFYTGAWQRGREQTCLACHMVGWTPGAGRTVGGATVLQGFARVDLNHRFRGFLIHEQLKHDLHRTFDSVNCIF